MVTENHIADTSKKVKLIRLDDLMKFPIRIDNYDKENGNEHFVLGIESVLEYAENLPTVDAVEVVHGEWGLRGDCSNCVETPLTTHKNFCPNCGADMRGHQITVSNSLQEFT